MQKRVAKRRNSSVSVTLFYKKKPIVSCSTKNICSTGMFINSGAVALFNIADLNIGFRAKENGTLKTFHIPVSLVHQRKDGIGLKFNNLVRDNDIYSHLMLGQLSYASR